MARRRYSKRRRGRGVRFLCKLLSVLVICGAIIAALTLFFRVDVIEIKGQQRYTEDQIRDAAGVSYGDNLFLLNKYNVMLNIREALPYVEETRINRKYPSTLLIQVKECGKPLAVVQDGSAWFVSPNGVVVDRKEAAETEGSAVIDGCQLLSPSVGAKIVLATEYSTQQTSLLDLLKALDNAGILEEIDAIHLEDLSMLSVEYAGRFTVELPYNADYQAKLFHLQQALEKDVIQDNMTGTFDMRREDGRIYFNPNKR